MKSGLDTPPAEALGRYFGLDLNDPRAVRDAMSVVEVRLRELESAYAVR